jgi:hypothetical protein
MVEDTGASISPKMATVMVAGGGRDGRATAGAIWIARELGGVRGEKTRERGRAGSVDPDPNRLVKPSQVGWVGRQVCLANRPVGQKVNRPGGL